jgi:hypothetical protein
MKDLAALLEGIGALGGLAWPLVMLIAMLVFRAELKSVLTRVRKGKILGNELELDENLDNLERGIAGVVEAVPVLADPEAGAARVSDASDSDIMARARGDARLALILAAGAIEKELREILAVTGLHQGRFNMPSRAMLRTLEERGMIPPSLSETIDSFWGVRNQIVHAHGMGASEPEVLRALDSGLSLLRLLRAIPRATYVVAHPGAPVYVDSAGTTEDSSVRAVILEEQSPGRVQTTTRAYPTTRSHFVTGKRVAWEWNPARTFEKRWYRDPKSGQVTYGWTESVEFVGRLLDDL